MGKTNKDSLGDRMKEFYENRSKTYLTRRTPVIIRLDGKAFHSFTKGFKRPYDEIFHQAMNNTMKYLCANIQGCKLGYTQSDEITLLLTDYTTLTTDAWFGYGVQKMCSVAASMATLMFNKYFRTAVNGYFAGKVMDEYQKTMCAALDKGAMFDARCFNVPKEEILNCFLWRFLDCYRNSVQMLGQTYFSSKQLYGMSSEQIQEKLFQELQINYAHCSDEFKNGICAMKNTDGKWELSPMKDPRKNREFFDSYLASVTE
jgi:tRNA(His) 5'-end guanylyltransferase